ncbi:MAG: methyltransferase domain-containing protein [Acidobacteria bacterium]|nr:methyltransferase domain-containing protein [Acidobacteriota bacterium]
MSTDREIAFFDRFEAEHGDYDVLAESAYVRILGELARRLRPAPGMTCIDLGCGTGAFTRRLGRFGLALTGVDISPRSIARAQQIGGATFLVGDVAASTAPAASFDVAVMSGVLHHLPARHARVAGLREARRLLKPGGRFFSYDPNGWSPSMFLYRDPRSPLYSPAGKTENEVLLTRRQLAGELRDAGFSDVQVAGLSGIAYRYVEGPLARRMLPLYNHVYENLMRLPGLQRPLGTFLIATARSDRC